MDPISNWKFTRNLKSLIRVLFNVSNEIKFEITMISPLRYRYAHVLKSQIYLLRFSISHPFYLIFYLNDIQLEVFKRFLPGRLFETHWGCLSSFWTNLVWSSSLCFLPKFFNFVLVNSSNHLFSDFCSSFLLIFQFY